MPKQTVSHAGRPPEVSDERHVTIADAAELAGVSYATVYRAVKGKRVRSSQAPNGVIYIARGDVGKIRPVERERADKPSVTVRLADEAQLKRWQRAAGQGRSLPDWLRELADRAAAK